MARSTFAGTAGDFLATISNGGLVRAIPGSLTIWSAKTGGTQYTDLLLDGSPVSSIPVGRDGPVPEFQGPDGVNDVWADAGGGSRVRLVPDIVGVLTGEDAAVSALVNAPASDTRSALNALIAGEVLRSTTRRHRITNPIYAGGADPTGATSSSAAIQAAVTAALADGYTVEFGDGTFLLDEQITGAGDNLTLDLTGATIVTDLTGAGQLYAFELGTDSDTPVHDGLTITGGVFTKADPAGTENSNYVRIKGWRNIKILNPTLRDVANGGITILTGCEDVLIDAPDIEGVNGYSTCRAIWLLGSTASDYAAQLMDLDSLTRNATPLPQYGVKRVAIRNPRIKLPGYGIYCMNAHDVTVTDPEIDVSGGGFRCVAFNNYSPRGRIKGGTLRGNQSSTGVLVTQYSDVEIDETRFEGSFLGGRDLLVQYGGRARTVRTVHKTDTTQMVQVNMAGHLTSIDCEYDATTFINGKVAIKVNAVDDPSRGSTATLLPGVVVRNATFRNIYGIDATADVSTGGNIAGFEEITLEECRAYNADLWAGNNLFVVTSDATVNKTFYNSRNNRVFPLEHSYRAGRVTKIGTGMTALHTSNHGAMFLVAYTHATTAVTSTKVGGDFMTCAASKSANDILVSPRTNGGVSPGSTVARVVGLTPVSSTIASWRVTVSGTNYLIRLFDAAGAQILLTADVSFYLHLSGSDEPI